MNTMYAIVANRTREVGTLRALGFSRVIASFLRGFRAARLAIVSRLGPAPIFRSEDHQHSSSHMQPCIQRGGSWGAVKSYRKSDAHLTSSHLYADVVLILEQGHKS